MTETIPVRPNHNVDVVSLVYTPQEVPMWFGQRFRNTPAWFRIWQFIFLGKAGLQTVTGK